MPLYEYRCQLCELVFESVHKMDEYEDGYPCPRCESGLSLKQFTKLTTICKAKDRKWGQSLYRSHDRGEKIGRKRRVKIT